MPIVLLEQKEKAGKISAEKRANKTAEETGGEEASAEAEKACQKQREGAKAVCPE
jgi:hypothetical protein